MSGRDELVGMFREAKRRHGQVFSDAGSDDPEWPLWYAEHLRERVNAGLSRDFTKSELVYWLVAADRSARAVGAEDWPEFYADFFLGIDG